MWPGEPVEGLPTLVPLARERAALQAYESEQVDQELRAALERTDLPAAAELCVHARRLSADTTGCQTLLDQLDEAPAIARIQVHATLYDAALTPDERRTHRLGAMEAAVEHRYTNDLDGALASQAGVTRAMGRHALNTLRSEYVVELDDTALLRAAGQKLGWLGRLPRSRIARGVPIEVKVPAEGAFDEAFDALVDQGVAAELPESLVVAELTEAVFHAGDTFSQPVWPAEVRSWDEKHSGAHPGRVGVSFDRRDGAVTVTGLHPRGEAWKAGVHLGDTILRVGELEVGGENAVEAVAAALRGPDGEAVQVVFGRDGKERALSLTRSTLVDRTVFGARREGADFRWTLRSGPQLVRIGAFRPHTAGEFSEAAAALDPTEPLILDLRGNVGGDLDAALAILDTFQRSGPMLHIEGRVKPAFPSGWGTATPGGRLEETDVAVLVDHQTASSAEILAGGLQQLGATVIGERTAGKGSSQVLRVDAERGFAMQFTNLHWALPDRTIVHRTDDATSWGVQPDELLVLTPTERYVVGVMQAEREALRVHGDGTPMPYTAPPLDPDLPRLSADPQIQAAARSLAARK